MKFLATAAIALALATTGEAYASSFVTLEAMPAGPSPSIIVMGEPALGEPPVVLAAPDATIKTAALSETRPGSPAEAARTLFGDRPDGGGEVKADRVAMLATRLSRSMILLGAPAPPAARTKRAAARPGRRPAMPMVIRGGLVGKAFPAAATSAPVPVEIVTEPPPSPDRRKTPEPPALPPAPPPPPPPSRQLE